MTAAPAIEPPERARMLTLPDGTSQIREPIVGGELVGREFVGPRAFA